MAPVQALGAFLRKMYTHMKTDSSFKENGLTAMTVPSDVTERELQDMYISCEIAQIPYPHFIDESTATVFHYVYEKMRDLRYLGRPKTVAFVDIGHTKATVTIVRFTLSNSHVLTAKILI